MKTVQMSTLHQSWEQAWSDVGLVPPADLFDALLNAYAEPQRHYHSQQHLTECLGHFDQVRHLAEHPGEIAIALWFHDAVYDVRGQSNERQSADWAMRALQTSGASVGMQQRVEQLIMATQHDATPVRSDEQLLVDIDLAILGAAPERFAEYDRQVRAEYRWVPGFLYKMKRKEVLRSFLSRPSIYCTDYFRTHHEAQARINLSGRVLSNA